MNLAPAARTAASVRSWPAIDVRRSAPADGGDLEGLVLAAIDDCSIAAVQDIDDGWRVFFQGPSDRVRAIAALAESWPTGLAVSEVDVEGEDWARRSQENLGPVRVGRITVAPPWAVTSSPLEVVIQPSMGFGTAHHATTRLCLALLQEVDLAGRRALDAGTGSGVLAIAAYRLGAVEVVAIDDDRDALDSARENLDLNRVQAGIHLLQADFRRLPGGRFDLVTANLTGALLVGGAAHLLRTVAPGGVLVLSGITTEEEDSVRAAFDPEARLERRLGEDGWVGLRYRR